ncbi:hypothetical protein B9Z55_029110 [Caenorhabditis nigoni]|uniref:DUF38 domain-containing protein n=1 Tax=Caenorhabditis nigoni TaxID=1611254 RepID=A0A2G5S8L2_9PELO|nr:hypothetical protein B9Z55_029110 [Caenorhabditis nigoni]
MDPPEMPKMLTQLSSICVLEYLSWERRQYIVSQYPEIRKAEKSLPLHLDTLRIAVDGIQLNEAIYHLVRRISYQNSVPYKKLIQWDLKNRHEVLPGDFCVGFPQGYIFNQKPPTKNPPFVWTTVLQTDLRNPKSDKILGYLPSVYDKLPIHVAFKKVVNGLIGNRPMVYTKKLAFEHLSIWDAEERGGVSKIYRLPVDLKIQAEILKSCWFSFSYDELDVISTILGPKPLKEFSTQLDNYEIFTHPIILNSEKLVLWCGRMDFDHQRINHRHIHLKNHWRITGLIEEWIGSDHDVEMEFSGIFKAVDKSYWTLKAHEEMIKKMMYLKKCESGGRKVKPDERLIRRPEWKISKNPNLA